MADTRSLSISARDLDALAAVVADEVSGVVGPNAIGNIRGIVDSVISRAAMGKAGGWPSTIQGVIDQKDSKGRAQYSGIGKAGGWESYSRSHFGKSREADVRAIKDAITDRLAE